MHTHIAFAISFFVGLLLMVCAAHADVVELTNGNRVEGDLRQVDSASVVIEVGGQSLTLGGAAGVQGLAPEVVGAPS